ncbi:DMT family transporter [Oxalobacteraceae bacterium R-40]|uniref:DMT family transporter n=1 Tax=Keguizhuia sedimenti TaxID=3064264 RepID=A0ABU1BTL4_9BURK|nr:DMT family transporter [Oxalobacteraceae bacterium R-40]
MLYLYIFLAVIAGVAVTLQVGVNSSLRFSLNSPVYAAFFSFAIGTVGLLAYALVTRAPWPTMQNIVKVPAWAWLGGLLGAYYVVTTIVAAPKLGAASLISLVVTTQLCTSLILDHYGLIGFAQHSINMWRVLGALLLIAGVVLIVRN